MTANLTAYTLAESILEAARLIMANGPDEDIPSAEVEKALRRIDNELWEIVREEDQ